MDGLCVFQCYSPNQPIGLGESFGETPTKPVRQGAVALDLFHLFRVVPIYMTGVLTYKVVRR